MDRKLKNLLITLGIIILLIIIAPFILNNLSRKDANIVANNSLSGLIKGAFTVLLILGVGFIWRKIKK